jgi:hypothetical protein
MGRPAAHADVERQRAKKPARSRGCFGPVDYFRL